MGAIVNEWAVCAPAASKRAAHSVILVVLDIIRERRIVLFVAYLTRQYYIMDATSHLIRWLMVDVDGSVHRGVF
jgi:hypothetical protein